MPEGSIVVVGGTGGIGREIARHYHEQGRQVVITGRDAQRAKAIASEIGGDVMGIGFDLSRPETIAGALEAVGPVAYLALVGIARDSNPLDDYTIADAIALTTMKLVGYTTVVNTLKDRMSDDSAVVLFGGRAKDRPYPGSTTVTTVNGGVSSLIRTLAIQLAPVRFNALHPGIVGDSPYWEGNQGALDATIARTPTKRLATMADVVDATVFLLENRAMNGENLHIDGGWMLM
jgi:NAD(P)-dependent dehydrogenase (short-subunit alcohol dehydrogenase family)